MGRYFAILDPDGFHYTQEPGAHFEWGAVSLIESIRERWKAANPTGATPADNFYSLPGHPWLMCRPRQLNPLFYRDSGLGNHVLRSGSQWTWDAAVSSSVREFSPSRKPGEAGYADDQWQTIPAIPPETAGLFGVSWDIVEAAAGFPLPTDIKVVGLANETPTGNEFTNLSPYIQVRTLPPPDDFFAFGFSEFLLLFANGGVTLLKSEALGGAVVRRLGQWSYSAPVPGNVSPFSAPVFDQHNRSVLVVTTPPGHLGLIFGGGNGAQVVEAWATEPGENRAVITDEGGWWVAAPVGSRITFQAQVVGFEEADTAVYALSDRDFDLGPTYLPNIEPSLNAYAAVHSFTGGADLSETITTNSFERENTTNFESVRVDLLDEAGAAWSSDGTHHAGRWRVRLSPSLLGGLSPYLRDIALKFPVFLAPRLNNPLVLDDTQFRDFTAETNYFDPDGKRITLTLWDTGAKLLTDAGFDTREGYPLQIWEDTDDDDIPDTLRVTGWVNEPEILEQFTETLTRDPVRFYSLHAKGLLSRGESHWLLLPQMVDPDGGGFVEHFYAVHEAVLAMGLDTSNPAQWQLAVDTMAGTARSRLPGTWNNRPYTLQLDPKNKYAPAYDEEKLSYAQRIATKWAGWLVYERLDGLVWYHPNLPFELTLGVNYFVSANVYSNRADALAASAPRQYYLAGLSQNVRPVEANSVRIMPPEPEDGKQPLFDSVVAHDSLGWTSPIYENFLGEPRPKTFVFEEADTQQAAEILAAVALLTLGQRGVDWPIEVPLAPWDWVKVAPVGVGYVIAVQGKDDRLITHEQVTLLRSRSNADGGSELRTRLTTTRLPANGSSLLVGTVPYPGRINAI